MRGPAIAVVVAMLAMAQAAGGETAKSAAAPKAAEPKAAGALAQAVVDDIRQHRGAIWPELVGRDDMLAEFRKLKDSLGKEERRSLLTMSLSVAYQKGQPRWTNSSAVTAYLVEAAVSDPDGEVRDDAAQLLVERVPSSYIRVHAAEILKAAEAGKMLDARLLGKTGAEEAKRVLKAVKWPMNVSESAEKEAAAKLGDIDASKFYIDAYQREADPREKARLAKVLGYIGDAGCVMALARDVRTPVIYDVGGAQKSLRLDIIAALSEVYPQEPALWWTGLQGYDELDVWYDGVEKWLQGYLGVTWQAPRPKPFGAFPRPSPMPPAPHP